VIRGSGAGEWEALSVFLTKNEWSLVWALTRLKDSEEYDEELAEIDNYATQGWENREMEEVEGFRRAIRWLVDVHSFDFSWLTVDLRNGSIRRHGDLCEPGNGIWPGQYAAAWAGEPHKLPEWDLNVRRASDMALQCGHDRLWSVLEDAAANVEAAAKIRLAEANPETTREHERVSDEALASVGMRRVPFGKPN